MIEQAKSALISKIRTGEIPQKLLYVGHLEKNLVSFCIFYKGKTFRFCHLFQKRCDKYKFVLLFDFPDRSETLGKPLPTMHSVPPPFRTSSNHSCLHQPSPLSFTFTHGGTRTTTPLTITWHSLQCTLRLGLSPHACLHFPLGLPRGSHVLLVEVRRPGRAT